MSERMSKDDLWLAIETLSRLLDEAYARHLPADVTGTFHQARGVAIAMYATVEEYSVKVPDVMPERFLIALPGGRA